MYDHPPTLPHIHTSKPPNKPQTTPPPPNQPKKPNRYAFHFLGFLASVLLLSIVVHLVVERPVANLERLTRSSAPPTKKDGGGATAGAGGKRKKGYGFAKAEEGKFEDGEGNGGITEPLLAATLQEEEGEDQVEEGDEEEAAAAAGGGKGGAR